MFDELTRDILTIVFFVITTALAIYSLDKEKKSKLKKLGIIILMTIGIGVHFYNIIHFFIEELSHRNIFGMVLSLVALSTLVIMYLLSLLRKMVFLNVEATQILSNQIFKDNQFHSKYGSVNTEVLLNMSELLEKINREEFSDKYKEDMEKIVKVYQEFVSDIKKVQNK